MSLGLLRFQTPSNCISKNFEVGLKSTVTSWSLTFKVWRQTPRLFTTTHLQWKGRCMITENKIFNENLLILNNLSLSDVIVSTILPIYVLHEQPVNPGKMITIGQSLVSASFTLQERVNCPPSGRHNSSLQMAVNMYQQNLLCKPCFISSVQEGS